MKGQWWMLISSNSLYYTTKCRCGETVDTRDLKSLARKSVLVRLQAAAPFDSALRASLTIQLASLVHGPSTTTNTILIKSELNDPELVEGWSSRLRRSGHDIAESNDSE